MNQKVEASLILPCYNEAEHFEESVKKIFTVLTKTSYIWEVIFIDDKSSDNTAIKINNLLSAGKTSDVSSNQQAGNICLRAIFHQKNLGRGATVAQGIKEAKGDFVGFIDIDCEVPPHYIPLFVDKIKQGFDLVCGWRIYQFQLSSLPRYLASKAYLFCQKKILGLAFPDTEAGYKFFRKKKIMPLLNKIKAKHWFWDTEIMVRSQLVGLKIAHIPTVFLRRSDKKSTVNLISDSINYLKNLWRLKMELNSTSRV